VQTRCRYGVNKTIHNIRYRNILLVGKVENDFISQPVGNQRSHLKNIDIHKVKPFLCFYVANRKNLSLHSWSMCHFFGIPSTHLQYMILLHIRNKRHQRKFLIISPFLSSSNLAQMLGMYIKLPHLIDNIMSMSKNTGSSIF